ncbi:MAG: type IX secretion system membrane protein PorP/SprF [Bacteroidetes bacterium]|nr:type IX secretion system membrane protein PorP/SprF [Bacteroidota bacterium]
MKKNLFFLLFILLGAQGAVAQLYPVFTQYYFNELVINPAYAGAHVQLSTTATYRNQWINFPGAPKTFSFTAHSSFVGGKVGLGMMINQDQIGSYSNQDVTISYAYKIRFPKSTLSFGIQGMAYFIKADFSSLNLKQGGDPEFVNYNQVKPNVGAGIYFNKRNFFVGLSAPYLINSKFRSSDQIGVQLKQLRNYFLRSGFIHNISKNVKINPSILVRAQEGQPLSIDINNSFIFYDVLAAGISYRSGDSVISFISLQLMENLYFNYSFDFTTSSLVPFSSGTQEFMINYRAKINAVHKNLMCPSYHSYRE